jgi:hypothetical protein
MSTPLTIAEYLYSPDGIDSLSPFITTHDLLSVLPRVCKGAGGHIHQSSRSWLLPSSTIPRITHLEIHKQVDLTRPFTPLASPYITHVGIHYSHFRSIHLRYYLAQFTNLTALVFKQQQFMVTNNNNNISKYANISSMAVVSLYTSLPDTINNIISECDNTNPFFSNLFAGNVLPPHCNITQLTMNGCLPPGSNGILTLTTDMVNTYHCGPISSLRMLHLMRKRKRDEHVETANAAFPNVEVVVIEPAVGTNVLVLPTLNMICLLRGTNISHLRIHDSDFMYIVLCGSPTLQKLEVYLPHAGHYGFASDVVESIRQSALLPGKLTKANFPRLSSFVIVHSHLPDNHGSIDMRDTDGAPWITIQVQYHPRTTNLDLIFPSPTIAELKQQTIDLYSF